MWKAAVYTMLLAATVAAQSKDWASVQHLKRQETLALTLRDRRVVRGTFERWTPSAIDIAGPSGVEQFQRQEVSIVRVMKRGSRAKTAMWGAIAGFAIAFPIGAAAAGHLTDRNSPPASTRLGMGAGLGLFGAGIGAGLGTLAGGSRSETIYRAP